MADTSGMTIGIDLPSYGELAKMLHNAERREKEAKRRLALVRDAVALSFARGMSPADTRAEVLQATRGRKVVR